MNKIFNENAINIMDNLIKENYKVDLVITDPPYKVTSRGGYTNAGGIMLEDNMRKGRVFKENSITIEEWLPKVYELLKDSGHCYIMTNNRNLFKYLKVIDDSDFHLIKTLVWAKDNKIMSQAYMSQTEFILFLRKGSFKRINNCGTSDLLTIPNRKTKDEKGKNIHPTEKPIELMEILINNSSNINEVVLDPFMGVGSTCIASLRLGRQYIGIELDERYYEVANERLKKIS